MAIRSIVTAFALAVGCVILPIRAAAAQDRPVERADSLSADEYVARAHSHERLRNYAAAAADYGRALALEPGHVDAALGLRRVGGPVEPPDEAALEAMRLGVDAPPDDPSRHFRYGEALYRAGRHDEAVEQFRTYLTDAQASPHALTVILLATSASGRHHTFGETVAEQYTAVYPGDDDILMRLGYFRLWQGAHASAIDAFRRAAALDSGNEETIRGLALADSLSRVSATIDSRLVQLHRAVEARPDDPDGRLALARGLLAEGRYYDAWQHLQIVRRLTAGDENRTAAAAAIERSIRAGDAPAPASTTDRLFARMLRTPSDTAARYALVDRLIERGRFFEAHDVLAGVRDEHGGSGAWLDRFQRIDRALVRADGTSPLFAVDRLESLLRARPDDRGLRFELVDSLTARNRFGEAAAVLQAGPQIPPGDSDYASRLRTIARGRVQQARRELDRADSTRAAGGELSYAARRALPHHLLTLGLVERARVEFRDLAELNREDIDLVLDWLAFLRQFGDRDRAIRESATLLQRRPADVRIHRAYVLARMPDGLDQQGRSLYHALLADSSAGQAGYLLELAELHLGRGDVADAELLLDRVQEIGAPEWKSRIETLAVLIANERTRRSAERTRDLLQQARRLAVAGERQEAIAAYSSYFEAVGERPRVTLREVASIHLSDGNVAAARSILEELYVTSTGDLQADTHVLVKELAGVRALDGDVSGALELIDAFLLDNSRDIEARVLRADLLRRTGDYEAALAAYDAVAARREAPPWLEERRSATAADLRYIRAESGEWTGRGLHASVAPTSGYVNAEGGGTYYSRYSRGVRAELTMPIGAVLTAGFESHLISGTRRLVAGAEETRPLVNEFSGGVHIDLTAPIASVQAPYSNRLSVEIGLFDYEGDRSEGHFDVRYRLNRPGVLRAEIGVRSTEGVMDLWSAGGGDFNLRLTQLLVRADSPALLPDSLLRASGRFSILSVTDDYGIASGSDHNVGYEIGLSGGYRVLERAWVGLAYSRLDFRSRTDLYFSPESYEATEVYMEYENEMRSAWYLRLRGAIGAVSRSEGIMSKRLEMDLTRRLTDRFSLVLSGTLGNTSRSLGGGASDTFSRYSMVLLSGRLYWLL